MKCSLESIKAKEVIDIKTGERLGYVDDVEFDLETSEVFAFKIYGRQRFFGLLGREEDVVIPCENIEVVGNDVMLIKHEKSETSANLTKNSKNVMKSLFIR